MTDTTIAQVAEREHSTPSGHVQVNLQHTEAGYTLTVTRETHGRRWGFYPTVKHEIIWQSTPASRQEAEAQFEQAVDLFV